MVLTGSYQNILVSAPHASMSIYPVAQIYNLEAHFRFLLFNTDFFAPTNLLKYLGSIYQGSKLGITVSADSPAPNGAGASAGTMMTPKMDSIYNISLDIDTFQYIFTNSLRDLAINLITPQLWIPLKSYEYSKDSTWTGSIQSGFIHEEASNHITTEANPIYNFGTEINMEPSSQYISSRDHSGYGLSQWVTILQCNIVSHWLSTCSGTVGLGNVICLFFFGWLIISSWALSKWLKV